MVRVSIRIRIRLRFSDSTAIRFPNMERVEMDVGNLMSSLSVNNDNKPQSSFAQLWLDL